MNFKIRIILYLVLAANVAFLSSCSKKKSTATGWNYNDPKYGGFEKSKYIEQKAGPGLIFVEGGTFVMGANSEDLRFDFNNVPKRVTVNSFYMDETEVTNIHYREYLYWLNRVFGEVNPEYVKAALPDTLVWRSELAYNEPYVDHYFRHPAYDDYPVVGVNWIQANEYCRWRTDRVNELALIKKGYLEYDPNQSGEDHFDTKSYEYGKYEGVVKKGKKNYDPTGDETRRVRFEDGHMFPDYRLPTEAEWEYAALALKGTQPNKNEERYTDNRTYPWSGSGVRENKRGRKQGDILANFQRGRGDYMGLAGALNDNASITARVKSFMPNDFGLYNMAGNVSEWCLDVYRPMSSGDVDDLNPFRGNVFETMDLDEEGMPQRDTLGRIKYREYTSDEIGNRQNYRKSNVVDFRDGDKESQVTYDDENSLISNKSRVIKGGSWNDRAYWLSPGTRRFLDEDQASPTVGFRCAMIRVGSPDGKSF